MTNAKVKIFMGSRITSVKYVELENEINEWLANMAPSINIRSVHQSCPGDSSLLVMTVFYNETSPITPNGRG